VPAPTSSAACTPDSRLPFRLCAAALAVVLGTLATRGQSQSAGTLAVSGTAVRIDGQPAFLTGVSFFDALGSVAPRDEDLDALKNWGVNTVRVWAHWREPIYGSEGTLTEPGRARLIALAARVQARGLILELVLLRPGQLAGQPFALFRSEAARVKAVEVVADALRPFRNVIFDLYNEHDHSDGPITHAAARTLRDRAKAIDPGRVVTISSTESHLLSPGGGMDENGVRNLRGEIGTTEDSVAVDLVAPHFPRTDDWAQATGARIAAVRAALDRLGFGAPIYLNEERRADPPTRIAPDAYQRALADARAAGAAGWVFHTAAGFELRRKGFLDALSPDERAGLQALRRP
jgi:hypothetical protein